MPVSPGPNPHACPHLEANDARCSHRFTLHRMHQAFSVCMSGWRTCPVYQMRQREQGERENHGHAISITVCATDDVLGRVGRAARPLRPTGS